ncbi:MAG TPA: pitrilysin family protein [Gemmatimonadaceae bacterium]|nr:pitrilysin family protein [Gemmatimonadaceae bacterium]
MALRKGLTWLRATLCISLACALLPVAAAAQRSDLEKIIHRRVLANGLEVIVVENHGVPLVTVEIDVKNGSFTQTPETAGLAHMYEHMFFRASRKYPGSDEFVERAADMGAVFNGSTREENVNYYMSVTSDRLEEAMRLLSASFQEPLFRQDELERERQVVIGEYDRNESNPFFALTQALDDKLYPGNAVRKNTIGDRNVISSTTPAQMRAIQKKYYVPNNSALIVTGDVNPAAAFATAEREFGSIPRGGDPFTSDPIPAIPALSGNDAVIHEAGVGAVTVFVQWQGPSVGRDPGATYAADVFSDVLNDPGSPLQQRLVDSGLWDGIVVNYYTLDNTGPITISGQTSPQRLRQALAALYAEIPQFANASYIDPEALAATKAVRAVSSAFDRERSSGFAHTLGFWWSVASLEYYMGYVDNMAAQTVADLTGYAAKYIVGKPRITGVLIHPDARRSLGLTTAELARGAR